MMNHKRNGFTRFLFLGILLCGGIAAFLLLRNPKLKETDVYPVFVNGNSVGMVTEPEKARQILTQVRKEVAMETEGMFLAQVELSIGECTQVTQVQEESLLRENMKQELLSSRIEKKEKAYTVKLNDYMVTVRDKRQVQELLQAVVRKYDPQASHTVEVRQDGDRDIPVLTANVWKNSSKQEDSVCLPSEAGFYVAFERFYQQADTKEEKDFQDYEYGILNMRFTEKVEIVEAYVPDSQVMDIKQAIEEVTKEKETHTVYKVQSGDTLSEIAIKVDIPMDRIVELNDSLENTSSTIRVGQELIITVPEPEVSVERSELNYYEEIYDAPVVYVERDDWYTNQSKVIQQPSAGFRKIVAKENYVNLNLQDREILKEEIVMEAVGKIVERGTMVPPTYIKPINGGRFTSGFGKRKAPKKGASTYHKGVDWAIPTGTAVYASCDGKVSKAGWGSGYGNVIYINHQDGRQTRYGHLSKILVEEGDRVKQGDKIALSGNTGVSTGPHIHFEILIDGKQVNPLNYIE